MKMGEFLQDVNSGIEKFEEKIDRNTVNYYIRCRFLNPTSNRSKRGFIRRYDFSEEDVRITKIMWGYHLQGMAPRMAFRRAQVEKNQAALPIR